MSLRASTTPFGWYQTIEGLLTNPKPPYLSGRRVLVVSDTSYKDGYVIDAVLCTSAESVREWNVRRNRIRTLYGLKDYKIHYTELKPRSARWDAIDPFLNAAVQLEGVALVVRTPADLREYNCAMIAGIQEKGLSRTSHKWNPGAYADMVSLATLIGVALGSCTSPGQSFHWISDHQGAFEHEAQAADIRRAMSRALALTVGHPLHPEGISTPLFPEPSEAARDLVSIVDLFAGGVGDIFTDVEQIDRDDHFYWQPGPKARRNAKAGTMLRWFLAEGQAPLYRRAFDLSLISHSSSNVHVQVRNLISRKPRTLG